MIFNKGGLKFERFSFQYMNDQIEIVQNYCYLGIELSAAGTFNLAISKLKEKSNKALFNLKYFDTQGNIDVAMKLFKSLVVPIATYASEVWAPYFLHNLNEENFMQICERVPTEQVHVKLCRFLLGVHRKSCTAAVKGELGNYPLLITSLCSAANFWIRLHNCEEDSLAFKTLKENYKMLQNNDICWLKHIKTLLFKFGMERSWENAGRVDINLFAKKNYLENNA